MAVKYAEYIAGISRRIKELEAKVKNQAIDILKNKKRFDKTLDMKYAGRVMSGENKLIKINAKIDKYKEVRTQYEEKQKAENENDDDNKITYAGGAI